MEKKRKKKKTNTIERDRISSLPCSILHHIFSFLNIEEAVQSSVLSKRWRYLWTSLHTLNFEFFGRYGSVEDDADRFERFVDKVLILRDGSNIQKFNILCHGHQGSLSSEWVNDWIISALRRNVQELVIGLGYDNRYRLPNCFYDSKSLTIFNLFSDDSLLELKLTNIPDSMCLPSLKTMSLHSLTFSSDEDATSRFFSSCPVLESLSITYSKLNQTNLKISSLSLKHLTIERDNGDGEFEPVDGSVKLSTPNLISFHCTDFMEKNYYVLENFSSLFKADIDLVYYDHHHLFIHSIEVKKNMFCQRMLKFLGALHNVTDLTLSATILEVVSGPALLGSNPIYRNLRSLKMDAPLSGDCIHTIICLLQMSPAIETLYINFVPRLIKANWEVELSSECLLNHLKCVEIRSAEGSVNELKFLETLLKNAVVLETLMIVFESITYREKETRFVKFGEKLRAFPKASSSITIMLI